MNPGKRLVIREDPITLTLPDLGTLALGAKVVTEDELGEFALGAVLGLHLGEQAGRSAAAGWRGDRYRVWEDSDGRLMIAYLLAMENERVPGAFALTYAKVLEKRHPGLVGKGLAGQTGALVNWQDGARAFAAESRGAEVLILEQVPAPSTDGLREAIWRARSGARAPIR